MCYSHAKWKDNHGTLDGWKTRRKKGSKWTTAEGYLKLTVDGNHVYEHRYIMEQSLGRKLLPDENVHHINGVRNDNRIENLELWSKSQPSGQRVQDKVVWAKEIIALYG